MKSLKWFVYFLILIVLGNFVLTGKEKVLPKAPTIKPPLPKRLPPPIKQPPLKWSDFKYNSEEEKEFWEQVSDFKIPNHYGWQRINSKGNKIDHDPFYEGYTGYQKKIEGYTSRILSKYQDGFLVKRASWYKSGKIKSEETYKDGKRFGVWNEWYENGKIKSEETYRDGKRFGVWNEWYENGQKKSEINYKDGNREGFSTKWHSNGRKQTEVNYREGKPEGLFVAWQSDGQKSSESNYKDGKRVLIVWYKNGQKRSEINHKDGKRDGLWIEWYENGQKRSEINHKDGERDGLWIEWYENGQKRKESNWKDGNKVGAWTKWYKDGKKMDDGERVVIKYPPILPVIPIGAEIDRTYELFPPKPKIVSQVKDLNEAKHPNPFFRPVGRISNPRTEPWSKFNYNSEEEKEFWDKLPDWTGRLFHPPSHFLGRASARKNARGETIDKNSSEGFDGYVKKNSKSYRTIYQFVDGYTSRWKSWFKSGKQMAEGKFLKENRDGTWNEWLENGEKKSEINYKDGKLEGLSTTWYENGQKKSERNYKDGKLEGLSTTWYENRQKESERNYKDGNVSGNAQFWTEDGKPSRPPKKFIPIPKRQQ